ncbi:hypothetical protein ACHAQH_007918 [Verticillium albo-atrum]
MTLMKENDAEGGVGEQSHLFDEKTSSIANNVPTKTKVEGGDDIDEDIGGLIKDFESKDGHAEEERRPFWESELPAPELLN